MYQPVRGSCTIVLGVVSLMAFPLHAQVSYVIDDGFAETAVSISPGETAIWMTSFPVAPGGEVIDRLSAMFGRPGGPSALNGLVASILLFQDANGGSPRDAVLLRRVEAAITGANTTALLDTAIPPTPVTGHLVAGVLFTNSSSVVKGIAPLDRTTPTLSDRSYFGFSTGAMDPSDLSSLPASDFASIESFGLAGNWVLRASGTPIPCPSVLLAAAMCPHVASRRRSGTRRTDR